MPVLLWNAIPDSRIPIGGLLVLYAVALGWQAWRVGITFDEPSHLAAGAMYWQRQDTLHPSDTPPLMRLISGWAPHALGIPLPVDSEAWKTQSSFEIGPEILRRLDRPRARELFYVARLTLLVFPLLTVWLVWHWARLLFGHGIALILAAGAAMEPTSLAHGSLLKSDAAAAFGCLLFAYSAWRYWRRPGLPGAAGITLALLVAVLAKFTLLVLIPVGVALVAWRGPRLAGAGLVLGGAYLGIIAGYQFHQLRPLRQEEFAQMRQEGFSVPEVAAARLLGRLPWPVQFIRGLRYIGSNHRQQGFPAYMLGRRIEYAAPLYFPLALAIKFPIGLQVLSAAGLAATLARLARRQATAADAFLWLPAVLLLVLALRSHIHIGFRHLLPVVPLLILGTGFALARWGGLVAARIVVAGCLGWLAVASAGIYPQGISYFNEWIGGPANGWKYLADSNLDWGQNLPELARYMSSEGVATLKLYYFGSDQPGHYLPPDRLELQAAPWAPEWEKEKRLEPAPGVYAVSVNSLLGYHFSPGYRDFFAGFQGRQPDARAGYSIHIYQVR